MTVPLGKPRRSLQRLEFHITTHGHLPGVRLSLSGDFGNIPFTDDAAAVAEIQRLADGRPYTLKRKNYRALPQFKGLS